LGLDAGNAESKAYDKALADAVKALYENAGYPAPGSEDPTRAQAARDARYGVADAKEARGQAAEALAAAEKAVAEAADGEARDQAELAADAARSSLALAERSVERAGEALADAERAAWTVMPLSAVVFISDLPRRVDRVGVSVGDDLANPAAGGGDLMGGGQGAGGAVVLSGADIQVTARVGSDEAALLVVGGPAVLQVAGGEAAGEIAQICPEATEAAEAAEAGGGECEVVIALPDLGGADPAAMTGNVLVTMVVGTTSADSLVVPVAAVSADTAGNARIEVVAGELAHDRAAGDQPTRIVSITPGLTAEGMVEVKETDGELTVGDLVVVGRGAPDSAQVPASEAGRG
jgi:hypothetical protein